MKVKCSNCGFEGTEVICDGCKIYLKRAKQFTIWNNTYQFSPIGDGYKVLNSSQKCSFESLQALT